MAHSRIARTEDGETRGVVGSAVAIIVLGSLLGVAYNWQGLKPEPPWGLSWIATDRVTEMPTLDDFTPADGAVPSSVPIGDDPMGVGGGLAADGLPEIPEIDRPIQMELAAVKAFVDAGAALIIDAREPEEFAAGRIPGAINMPYEEVSAEPERLEAVDSGGRPIIVYCGGGTCELSMNMAYDLLFAGKSRVLVYMGGYPEWSDSGYAIETDGGGA